MKRRDFLRYVGASGYAALPSPDVASAGQSRGGDDERPNFLVIMSDQHSPHVLGCYGDPIVRTPNLDALASRGILFRNAYCAAPICVASRSAFLTSQLPSATRVWGNIDTLGSDIPTFAHALGAAGYDTALIGRMHFSGVDQWHGFGKRLVGDVLPQYACLPFPLSPELTPGATGASRKAVEIAGPGKTAYQAYDADVTKAAIQYLKERADVREKPFCAVVGLVLPHAPFVCSRAEWDYYYQRVTLPENPPGYFEHLHPAMQHWRQVRGVDDIKPEEVRRARAGYYGLVTEMDQRVGQILGALNAHEYARNTVVIYTSDHGEMAGENGIWWKMNLYEGSASVPLIVSCPARWAPRVREEVTNLIDVAPTLLDAAGADPLPQATGNSLVPLLANRPVEWINETFSEYPVDMGVPSMRMIRSGRWKLIHFDGERPQLFDLQTDPHEFRDLADDSAHTQVLKILANRVVSAWSPEEIKKDAWMRGATSKMMAQWATQVRPPVTIQWVAPPEANIYPEKL